MPSNDVSVVLVHDAWADGSSWAKVITALAADGMKVIAAPLPLTSFADDVAALNRTLERVTGPVVLAAHAYASGGSAADFARVHHGCGGATAVEGPAGVVSDGRARSHDRQRDPALHG